MCLYAIGTKAVAAVVINIIKSMFCQNLLNLPGSVKIIFLLVKEPSYVSLPYFFIKVFHRLSCFKVIALPARSNGKLYDSIDSIES
jgi:hypothetical protein